MTTKITVNINNQGGLLDKAQALQAKQRQLDSQAKEEKKEKKQLQKEAETINTKEEERWKGAVADPEETEDIKNRPKPKRCGFWVYKDYVFSAAGYETTYRTKPSGNDIFQISIGSGDGTQWATHYVESPGGKPQLTLTVTGSISFIGYLSYVQYYAPGSGFGTVYTLPEGATETPYDPMVYLQSTSSNWGLYFPDELNSGEAKYRKMVTVTKMQKPVNAQELAAANQALFCFPINNRKTVVIAPTWVHWSNGYGGEYYSSVYPAQYVLHPQNSSQPSIKYTVYYKNAGGPTTGWTPINGFYWLMDPNDSESIMNNARLGQLFPLDNTITHIHDGKYDMVGFVVSHNRVKKLEKIPDEVTAKVKARCPEPFWDDSNIIWARYNARDPNDDMPGYPPRLAEDYNNESWEMNPDGRSMGVARNIFWNFKQEGEWLPYDYWLRNLNVLYYLWGEADCFSTHRILGVSPGGYDAYDEDLQEHKFINHYGKGNLQDLYGYGIAPFSVDSKYGVLRLLAPDITRSGWKYLREAQKYNVDLPNAPETLTKNDIGWMYLNSKERLEFYTDYVTQVTNYTSTWNTGPGHSAVAHSAPDHAEFNYVYYLKSTSPENPRLTAGIRWISEGDGGSWTDASQPAFNYNSDPYYDQPYMDITDEHWKRYKLSLKLSPKRAWPPSISQNIMDPIPANAPLDSKKDHPLAKGRGYLSLVINTAWDNDYSKVLFEMGFTAKDLAI